MDPTRCRLCGATLPDPEGRCPTCGMDPTRELAAAARWRIAAGLVAVYVFVAAVLALTR